MMKKKIAFMSPDPRQTRLDQIKQEIRDPARLNDQQIQSLLDEMAELMASLQQYPPNIQEDDEE